MTTSLYYVGHVGGRSRAYLTRREARNAAGRSGTVIAARNVQGTLYTQTLPPNCSEVWTGEPAKRS